MVDQGNKNPDPNFRSSVSMDAPPSNVLSDETYLELDAEAITIRVRWFGLFVGTTWVNCFSTSSHQSILNAILALGAIYALLDTYYSLRGRVFLAKFPLFVSAMEAVFIGLLCHFDAGTQSLFRFYYFLSLMVCAIRHSAGITYTTFAMHSASVISLAFSTPSESLAHWPSLVYLEVLLGWMAWACTALASLLRRASDRLTVLNRTLQQNQLLLEDRIQSRTLELQQSQDMLVQHEKQAAFGLLAAGIAHEVGNPLAAISYIVQLLNRRNIDDHTREKLQVVGDQLTRIQRTLKELVNFSRPASSEVTVCNLHEVIESALSIAKYYKRKKGRLIETDFAAENSLVRLVSDEMVQVFLNLILNALDATPEGGTLRIETRNNDQWILVSVIDTGHGISPEHQPLVFQPYFTTKTTGTGLGLFVCRNIVEKISGGRLELDSSSPAGTRFTVYLPKSVCENSESMARTIEKVALE